MSNHAASRKHYYTVLLDRTLVCFLLVVVLNFFLPRLLPGNPVAYLTGFSEQDMTPAQVAFLRGRAAPEQAACDAVRLLPALAAGWNAWIFV